jgi:hypothetical protein
MLRRMSGGSELATVAYEPGRIPAATWSKIVRTAMLGWMMLALLLLGMSVGRANDRDETIVTVQVSSADHEVEEGYFALGDSATVMAKPGSDLHRFLTRQRGRKVKIILTEEENRELSRLNR